MKRECAGFEELIWESLRNGDALPDDAARHIERCGGCARAYREARRAVELLRCAVAYPEAPDCRAAVRERISRAPARARGTRFAWVYAGAAAALVLAAILPGVLRNGPAPVKPSATRIESAAPANRAEYVQPKPSAAAPGGVRVASAQEPARRLAGNVPSKRNTPSRIYRPKKFREPPVLARDSRESLKVPTEDAEAAGHSDEEQPVVTVVSVEWSAQPAGSDYSYEFVEEDTAAETATRGLVVRTGDSIEIRMETAPVAAAPPPRGEISHEISPAG